MRKSAACLLLIFALAACGKRPQSNALPAPAPASQAVPAATSAVAALSTAAAATAAVPAVASAPVAATTAAPAASTAGPEVAGQVAVAQGSVTDTASDGTQRSLKDGDLVYPGDAFAVGQDSYLDLDFEDGGRVLLRPGTNFQIQSYHFEPTDHPSDTDASGAPLIKPANPQPESAFFRLAKGGLRAIDGLIGQSHHENYGIETPVATIGVRGTAFDVRYCGDDCADESDASGKPDNGLYTSVSDGSVDVKNDDGDVLTTAGHSGYVKSRKHRLQPLKTPPKALRHMDLPAKLKPRAAKNRTAIRQQRRQRIQRRMERRRQVLQRKELTSKGNASADRHAATATPAERRQLRREKRDQKPKAAPALRNGRGLQPARAEEREQPGRSGKEETVRERRQQRRQQQQDKPPSLGRRKKQQAAPADTQSGAKTDDDCKVRKGRGDKGKKRKKTEKDKCAG